LTVVVKEADAPLQIVALFGIAIVGIEFTVTVAVAFVAAHPPIFTVTVYGVVTVGLIVSV
jgi:hypothetical protein